jgi:hypothetical protein
VGWDFANFYQSGAFGQYYSPGLEVDFSDGTKFTNSYTGSVFTYLGGPEFVGFTSTVPISSFVIMGGGYPTIENFSFGATTAAVAPEPASFTFVLVGLSITLPLTSRWILANHNSTWLSQKE